MPSQGKRKGIRQDTLEFIGGQIRARRVALGMSQEELGQKLGDLTFQQIQKYEKGSNAVSTGRLKRLCELLETDPNNLIGFDDDSVNSSISETGRLSPTTIRHAILIEKLEPAARGHLFAFIAELVLGDGGGAGEHVSGGQPSSKKERTVWHSDKRRKR